MRKGSLNFIKSKAWAALAAALLLSGCAAEEEAPLPSPEPTQQIDITEDADKLRISEVMVKNRAMLQDEDGDFSDWIELENVSQEELDLSGWYISDDNGELGWAFPEAVLGPGERMVVFASGKDRTETLHTDFSLSLGESVCLYNKHGYLADELLCQADNADVSVVLNEQGEWVQSLYPSPGFPNTAEGYENWQAQIAAKGPLAISEVAVANFSGIYQDQLGNADWAEIKNISDSSVNLAEYYLSDDDDNYCLWAFPNTVLEPGQTVLVWCDDSEAATAAGVIRAPFSLDSTDEQLYLADSSGKLADYISLRDIPYECSYGRIDGQGGWFFFSKPSPGSDNGSGYRRVAEKPTAVQPDGVYNDVSSVTVELSGCGEIYYTTDSSVPTVNSLRYEAPFTVDKTTVVRAISVEEGAMPSRTLTLSYIVNENHSLPVLSLVSDNTSEFRHMYSVGMKGMETPGSLSLYEEHDSFTISCGIKMHGETSLILPKKNMSVRFRGAYGDEMLEYDAFGGGVTEFSNFILRAGQDYYSAIIRNELCENLCLASSDNVITTRNKYCVLYVNGKYSGIYALMEKTNEQLYASLAGVSKDSVTVTESVAHSSTDFHKEVIDFCVSHDLSDPKNYEAFCSIMDVDSLIDWMIMEGFCANGDFTYGNLRYCRSTENDGKWRLMFYDLDSSFLNVNECFYNVFSYYWLQTRQVSLIIAPLLQNEQFVDRFLSRAGELLNTTLTNENVLAEIDRLAKQIEPEVARDYARYDMTLEEWYWDIDWLKDFISGMDWQQYNIDTLCQIFDLNDQEREKYFG